MYENLIATALSAREQSYSPYSGFKVGAALLGRSGNIFPGANVENSSYGLTICAERAAAVSAIAAGVRDFVAVAIVTDTDEPTVPCGGCRQFLAEFNPQLQVILRTTSGKERRLLLSELFPEPFTGGVVPRRT